MMFSVEGLNYQGVDSIRQWIREPGSKLGLNGSRLLRIDFCTPGTVSKGFGLTYIIKELSECFQRAVPAWLVFRAWWDKGLHHAESYPQLEGMRKSLIANGPASTIILVVCLTNEFELVVDESNTSLYAEESDQIQTTEWCWHFLASKT